MKGKGTQRELRSRNKNAALKKIVKKCMHFQSTLVGSVPSLSWKCPKYVRFQMQLYQQHDECGMALQWQGDGLSQSLPVGSVCPSVDYTPGFGGIQAKLCC